jgi:hypothetical protein
LLLAALAGLASAAACTDAGETSSLSPTSAGSSTVSSGGAPSSGGSSAGKAGAAGKSGGAGTGGSTGKSGAAGQAGTSAGAAGQGGDGGTGGAAGQAGVSGSSGQAGTAGAAGGAGTGGVAGKSGAGGVAGQAGSSGAAGQAGSSGAAGQAGSSGASGSSGAKACNAVEQAMPIEGATHVTPCTYVDYQSNPPTSGNHYPVPTQHKSYTTPVPRGFWVHNLEHGGVVFSYNCPTGCADDIAAAQAVIDAAPIDPVCAASGTARRVLMTPDPHLDVKFAASAWGFSLRADCFDKTAFAAFLANHYAMAPEAVCWDGPDQSMGQPADCGEPGFVPPDGG